MIRSATATATAMGLVLFLISCSALSRAEEGVTAPGSVVQKLAGNFEFTEGPTDIKVVVQFVSH